MPSNTPSTRDLCFYGLFQCLLWPQCKQAAYHCSISSTVLTMTQGKQISSTMGKPCPPETLCLDLSHRETKNIGCVPADSFVKKIHNGGAETTYAFPPSDEVFTYSCYKTVGSSTDYQDSHSGSTIAIVVDNIEKFGSDVHYITWQGRSRSVVCKVSGAPHVTLWSTRHKA